MLAWLAASGGSLLVTTYNAGKLACFSAPGGVPRVRIVKLARPMGLAVDATRLAVACRDAIELFRRGEIPNSGHAEMIVDSDAVFASSQTYRTARLDAHDLALAGERLYFANTRFNCLARPSRRVNFLRSWQPQFISEMRPTDCCHLNGLGVRNGRPALMTAFAETDQPKGWRRLDRFTSGVVIDIRRNAVVGRGLNMPHSPRRHAGRWWLCESGAGVLAKFDPGSGRTEEVAALPGFTRGLSFVDDFALVGTSRIRREHVLDWPPLRRRHAAVRAGVSLVHLATGAERGAVEFVRGGSEVYEVAFLPGATSVEIETLEPAPAPPNSA